MNLRNTFFSALLIAPLTLSSAVAAEENAPQPFDGNWIEKPRTLREVQANLSNYMTCVRFEKPDCQGENKNELYEYMTAYTLKIMANAGVKKQAEFEQLMRTMQQKYTLEDEGKRVWNATDVSIEEKLRRLLEFAEKKTDPDKKRQWTADNGLTQPEETATLG